MNLLNDNKPLISRACLLFVTLVLIIAGCSSSKTDESKSKIEPIAAIYYSTDLPNEKIGDGLSYLFLIDRQGKHTTIKKRGLELNSIIPYKGALLLNQKNELLSIKQDSDLIKSTSFEEDCKVYAGYGQSSGQVNDQNTFYSIYNQSFSSDRKHYISKIRWGDQTNNYCKDINEYIEVSGDDGSSIFFISSETEDGNKKSFHKLSIESDKLIMTKTFLEQVKTDGRFMFTKLIPYSNDMVGIYADLVGTKVELNLIQIDKDNKTPLKKHPLVQYDRSNTHYYFFNKESIYVKDGQVYFVDGYGDVYAFNLTTKKLMKKFHLNEYTRQSRLQDEMVYFHKNYLYFFRYNDKTSSHQIEKYNLQGNVESTIILPDLKKKLGNNSVNLYDFKILQP